MTPLEVAEAYLGVSAAKISSLIGTDLQTTQKILIALHYARIRPASQTKSSQHHRSLGLCRCGRSPLPGKRSCPSCLSHARARYLSSITGLCCRCGKPAISPSSPFCRAHRILATAASRASKARKKARLP